MSARTLALFAALVSAHAAGAAPVADDPTPPKLTLPDTYAGRKFAEWLKAINGNDPDAIRAFAEANLPADRADRAAAAEANFARNSGGLDVFEVTKSSEYEIEVRGRTKLTENWVTFSQRFADAEPHHLLRAGLRPGDPPEGLRPRGKLSDEEIAARLEAYVSKLVAADSFSGAVLVARDGAPIFARAYGMADREKAIPNRLDTKFSLASMGKMFTAVAIAQLAEQGKLSFDDTVGKHLPDYPNREVAEKVTIHQLLTHTSGLGDFFNDRWKAMRSEPRSVKEYLDLFVDDKLAFEPGSRWAYSNGGFVVLGAILEKITGQDYDEAIVERVFKPAGMRDSGFFSPDGGAPNMATGYTHAGPDGRPRPGPWRSNADHRPGRGNPAGGAWSSAEDLLRFAGALREHRLLGPEMTERVTGARAETGQGPGERYGYGFMVLSINGHRAFGHYGGFPGVSTGLEVYPDRGLVAIVLSNYDMGGQTVLTRLHEWIARD